MNRFKEMILKFGNLNKPCFKGTQVGDTTDNIIKFYRMYWGLYSETDIKKCDCEDCRYIIRGRYVRRDGYMYNLFTFTKKIGDMNIPCSFLQVLDNYNLQARFSVLDGEIVVKLIDCPEGECKISGLLEPIM